MTLVCVLDPVPHIFCSAYFCLQYLYSILSLCIGVKDLLQNISEKQGKQMNSHESAKDIPKFIEFFNVRTLCPIMLVQGQLKMDEAKYPIEYFKVFAH
ncbi:hypothetical protein GW17_00030267 [Ensete ventricosum]|nr:hypothetical protein GW17_00030267 [Ensete ventricosum]RZR80052.1 hypothetical protein BHM03_00005954 [Ensete ventricosum]